MIVKNYYVLFSDSKKSEKVTYDEFLTLRCFARSLNAVLSEVSHRSGITLSVAFARSLFCHYKLSLFYETTFGKNEASFA